MQTQPQTRRSESPASQEWYVVADDGASAFRMTPGLTVGEFDSGTLALNDSTARNQWVEFVVAANGEAWATIVTRDKSLRVAGTTCLRYPLQVGAAIQLPNNTLHISRDIRAPRLSGTVVEVVHRDIPQPLQNLVGPAWEEAASTVREPRPGMPAQEMPEPSDPAQPEPNRGAWYDWSDRATTAEPRARTRRPQTAARRHQVIVMAGALALGGFALAGVVAVLVSLGGGEVARVRNFEAVDTRPANSPAEAPAPVESSGGASPDLADDPVRAPVDVADGGAGADAPPTVPPPTGPLDTAAPTEAVTDEGQAGAPDPTTPGAAQTAGASSPPATDAAPPPEPAATTDSGPETVAMLPRTETESPEPVALPPVERRSPPEITQTTGFPEAAEGPLPVASEPDPALVAELERVGLAAQAVSTELTRRRDLLAADLALAQGRLTTPPEASAYALYHRVLAVDPGSPEATTGLQSVRQGLINRALAQLAGNDLDAARQTLQAAADAGADPQLVADLRGEVDYRQQSMDAGPQTSINSSR